jgi:DNA-binding NtrC family response regulator
MTAAPKLLGKSPVFTEAISLLERAAVSDVPVLVLGESGTGKEMAARLVHGKSARAKGPFVAINLAALPASLIEDELFGHEMGAFTGATTARTGRFRRAHGGTLFLDEIGDIPTNVQVKLLRVLEEGLVEPLGSETATPVDVRIVAATHRDLNALVAKGSFRADLLFRLAVFPVSLPPLRERGSDVSILAEHFAAKEIDRLAACQLSAGALEALRAYSWPGNVRELENAVMRARALKGGNELEASDFGFLGKDRGDRAREVAELAVRYGVSWSDLEKRLLEEAIRACHGNEAEAARRLGISRRAIDYRLQK